jgi:hypothetical protein
MSPEPSHSSADKPVARKIAAELRNKGVEVWIDERSISAGSSIGEAVAEGIDSSDYFMILLSGKSVQSRWVHEEANMAFQKAMEVNFPIIPVRLDGTPVPRIIKHLKYIDFRAGDDTGLEEILSLFKQDERLASDRRKLPSAIGAAITGAIFGAIPIASSAGAIAGSAGLPPIEQGGDCVSCLKGLTGKALRLKIIGRYDYEEISTIWYDLFDSKISNDIPSSNLANAIIELIDKSKRKGKFDELLSAICQEHPEICP